MSLATSTSLQGILSEPRNEIYGLVAADTPQMPTILGRKVAQSARNFEYEGDIRAQALSAIVQHPLSMTTRQVRAEFQSGFNDDSARHQTYEFVVDNFDFEQLKLFEELQHAKHGDRFRLVKSRSQMMRDRALAWLSKVSFTLRLQMDQDVVASVTTLTKSLELCSQGHQPYSNVPYSQEFLDVDDYLMIFKYRDMFSGVVDEAKTMTIAQATEAFEVLRKSREDGVHGGPMLYKLLMRFTALLDGHAYLESQQKDQLETLVAKLWAPKGEFMSS